MVTRMAVVHPYGAVRVMPYAATNGAQEVVPISALVLAVPASVVGSLESVASAMVVGLASAALVGSAAAAFLPGLIAVYPGSVALPTPKSSPIWMSMLVALAVCPPFLAIAWRGASSGSGVALHVADTACLCRGPCPFPFCLS